MSIAAVAASLLFMATFDSGSVSAAACGPGAHWIDTCPAGTDNMSQTGALMAIDVNGDCIADQNFILTGPVRVTRSAPMDDSVQFPGTRPVDGHMDVIDTEIVSMTLTGNQGLTLRVGTGTPGINPGVPQTLGAIAEQPGDAALGDSFFDVFFEVSGGMLGAPAYNQAPLTIQAVIDRVPPETDYMHPPVLCLDLFTAPVGGVDTGINLVDAEHSTGPPHYKCYQITGPDETEVVNLQTQFGIENNVAVGDPEFLCPPALKNGEGNLNLPHLKCYNIVGYGRPIAVTLDTQFGVEPNVAVGPPKLLCAPAIKEVISPVPVPPIPVDLTQPHYKCYEINGPDIPNIVTLETQFGIENNVPVGDPDFLCPSAIKNGVGDLGYPYLKCYNIPPNDPPHVVNLTTQFGVENNVAVGPSALLCVPGVFAAVGGFAEREGEGGAPVEAADSSGGSSLPYAALAGVAAAALAVVAGGGWYARRRWLR